jgi:acetyl-CoA carboxylase carboxyl transferase subunit beta
VYRKDLIAHASVCRNCGYHHRIDSAERIRLLADPGSFEPLDSHLSPTDPLAFKDRRSYADRLRDSQKATGLRDAVVTGFCQLEGRPLALGVMDFRFMGGSMGSVVGERFARGVRAAIEQRMPFICIAASGGARMQEGVLSLVQMSKCCAALTLLASERLPFISVLTDPTMGGVSASFAMIGDVVIAEPGSLVGFAGPRVIQQTVRETLPDGFQRAEFLLEHGAIDMIVDRRDQRERIGSLLRMLMPLAERGINLSKIESRPSKRRPWDYYFFLDVTGHYEDSAMREAIAELRRFCPLVKWLGSYPQVG